MERHDRSEASFSYPIECCLPQQIIQQTQLQRSFVVVLGVMSMVLLLLPTLGVNAAGYSYAEFIGPVAGPEHKIYVSGVNAAKHGKTQQRGSSAALLDYVAKPEYEFAYGVEDASAHVLHNRKETRDGDTVKGFYSLIDPDGTLRVVKYTADGANGFQAEVIRNGVSSIHGHNRAPPSEAISYSQNTIYRPNHDQQHYAHTQAHAKGDRNVYHPSYGTHTFTPHPKQLPQANHKQYQPHRQQLQTPTLAPIVYYYNENTDQKDDRDDSNESNNKYREDRRKPEYKVHEKASDDTQANSYEEAGNIKKSNSKTLNDAGHKHEKQDPDEYESNDEEDYDDSNYSEELEDYDESIHKNQNSDENDDYY